LAGRDSNVIGRLSAVGALWDCVPRVCGGGGGCAGGGVPLGAVPVLFWCGEVSLGGKHQKMRRTRAGFALEGGAAALRVE